MHGKTGLSLAHYSTGDRVLPVYSRQGEERFMSRAQRKTAFTLIELLVVIAIIAILAAILFPVFIRARENARRTSCASNMKQIGHGLLQYTQDYDETLPAASGYGAATTTWRTYIYSYVKSPQIFVCPSRSRTKICG